MIQEVVVRGFDVVEHRLRQCGGFMGRTVLQQRLRTLGHRRRAQVAQGHHMALDAPARPRFDIVEVAQVLLVGRRLDY
jgi:hypothetical protein